MVFAELISVVVSLLGLPALFMTLWMLPCLFIFPGTMLILVIRRQSNNLVRLVVEGFFVSTLLAILFTTFMFALSIPISSLNYSLICFFTTLILSVIAVALKVQLKYNKLQLALLTIAFISYISILIAFFESSRFFTPDETTYIFSARQGISTGAIPPMGVNPNASTISMLLQARFAWTYLLASFLSYTGLPVYQSGLLGIVFLVMTALGASLFFKNKLLSIGTYFLVILCPQLLLFSNMVLNDLVLGFYVVLSVLFFVEAFSKKGDDQIDINSSSLVLSFLLMIIIFMIKPNVLIFVSMVTVILFVFFRYRLYRNLRKNIILIASLLPVLFYELCVDLPYVLSVWVFRNAELGSVFQKLLFISPLERLLHCFISPYWNPTSPTIFNQTTLTYVDVFYTMFTPETNLLLSAVLLSLPVILLLVKFKGSFKKNILTFLVLASLLFFYFEALISMVIADVIRYSLWLIPLSIPLCLFTFYKVINSKSRFPFVVIFALALLLLFTNLWLNANAGGVYVSYGLSNRLSDSSLLIGTFSVFTFLLCAFLLIRRFSRNRTIFSFGQRKSFVKKVFVCALVIMVASEIYVSVEVSSQSKLFDDQNLLQVEATLNNIYNGNEFVFANNFIYLRTYVNSSLLVDGLLLPPPDTEQELFAMIDAAPNGTIVVVSNSDLTAWYSNANVYIKKYSNISSIYSNNNVLLAVENVSSLNGNVTFFKLSRYDQTAPQATVVVTKQNMVTYPNNTVGLNLQITSDLPTNCSFLVSTDQFTKVYLLNLTQGENNISYNYPAMENPNWVNLAQSRLILFMDGQVIYNQNASPLNLSMINPYLMLSMGFILVIFLFTMFSQTRIKRKKLQMIAEEPNLITPTSKDV